MYKLAVHLCYATLLYGNDSVHICTVKCYTPWGTVMQKPWLFTGTAQVIVKRRGLGQGHEL